jgi:hypothetical protein
MPLPSAPDGGFADDHASDLGPAPARQHPPSIPTDPSEAAARDPRKLADRVAIESTDQSRTRGWPAPRRPPTPARRTPSSSCTPDAEQPATADEVARPETAAGQPEPEDTSEAPVEEAVEEVLDVGPVEHGQGAAGIASAPSSGAWPSSTSATWSSDSTTGRAGPPGRSDRTKPHSAEMILTVQLTPLLTPTDPCRPRLLASPISRM